MKLTITKSALVNALRNVIGAAKNKTTLPILYHVLIEADMGMVKFTASDLDVFISSTAEADVKEAGKVCLPADKLLSIATSASSETLELKLGKDSRCAVIGSDFSCNLNGMSADEFPPIPKVDGKQTFKLATARFAKAIRQTAFAMSDDASRYILNGVYLGGSKGSLEIVATDGRRLALVTETIENQTEFGIVLPSKAVLLLKGLADGEGEVVATWNDSQVRFELANGVTVITKQIEGNYVNYRIVIPTETSIILNLETAAVGSAVQRASIFTSEKASAMKMELTRNQLAFSAASANIGDGRVTLDIKHDGKDLAIAFDPKYVMAGLNAIEMESFEFRFIDELSPGVMKTSDGFLYVVMPMRLNG